MSNYVTAIGLDVHARSISACAFDPMTGEVTRARFGYEPASVAEWVLGFESPKAVYESGPTGFHLCRALRALGVDCAVGAVSKMHRPAADRGRKNDRRPLGARGGLLHLALELPLGLGAALHGVHVALVGGRVCRPRRTRSTSSTSGTPRSSSTCGARPASSRRTPGRA